ncbi:MAG: AbiV family abortive infection protein [Opitutaceae bacterium]|nr:AbiV family abortive infection protein [Opitutaceae bacterium]
MRQRAVYDLADLADPEFFAELETGIGLCVANATRIMADVAVLAKDGRYQAARILQNVANEETAKAMILMDAVRCPRAPKEVLVRQLKYFAQHLPKGLYVCVAEGRPCSFAEVQGRIERERKQYYLDGPDGGEFAVCNYILSAREQAMYVDYIVADESKWWHDPVTHHLLVFGPDDFRPGGIFRMVSALHAAGCFSAAALATIADLWRCVTVDGAMTIHELRDLNEATLRALDAKGLLKAAGREAFGLIVNECPFPLHPLDLTQEKVNKEALLEQRSWPGYT